MKKILATALALASGAASAQEVPISTYVGDGAIGGKVYGQGFLACQVVGGVGTCKLGNGTDDWDTRSALANDARYPRRSEVYLRTDLDNGALDTRYYTIPQSDALLLGKVAVGTAIQVDGAVGYNVAGEATGTTSYTPAYSDCPVAQVQITSGTGNFIINAPTGTPPLGHTPCIVRVNNQSGATRNVVFAGIDVGTDRLNRIALENTEKIQLHIYDADETSGIDWRFDGAALDFAALPINGTPANDDLVLCQDVSDNPPGTWKSCTVASLGGGGGGAVDSVTGGVGITAAPITGNVVVSLDDTTVIEGSYVSANIDIDAQGRIIDASDGPAGTVTQINTGAGLTGGPITDTGTISLNATDSDILGNSQTETTTVAVTAVDHGKTIVCNNASGMAINVNDGATNWSPDYRVYVLNIGAGDCTIQDGTPADVTIRTAAGFTAVVPQYGGATIIGINTTEVAVTGGAAQ